MLHSNYKAVPASPCSGEHSDGNDREDLSGDRLDCSDDSLVLYVSLEAFLQSELGGLDDGSLLNGLSSEHVSASPVTFAGSRIVIWAEAVSSASLDFLDDSLRWAIVDWELVDISGAPDSLSDYWSSNQSNLFGCKESSREFLLLADRLAWIGNWNTFHGLGALSLFGWGSSGVDLAHVEESLVGLKCLHSWVRSSGESWLVSHFKFVYFYTDYVMITTALCI